MKETKKVKEKTLAKEREKGMFENKKSPQEAAGHNSGPQKQTYYCGSGLVTGYPSEKLFGCCFFSPGVSKASYIINNC